MKYIKKNNACIHKNLRYPAHYEASEESPGGYIERHN